MIINTENRYLHWYQYDASFSIDLLQSYVDSLEMQIDSSIKSYQKKEGTEFIETDHGDGNYFETVIHNGVDDQTWDLKDIFEEYFPNLQRRSALVTLFSFLEKELDSLCILFEKENNYKISLKDISEKGIDRATNYLLKVVELNFSKTCSNWNEIKNIQKIRNSIIHNGGLITSKISGYTKSCEFISGEKEIFILNGYLPHVLSTVDEYFKSLVSHSF